MRNELCGHRTSGAGHHKISAHALGVSLPASLSRCGVQKSICLQLQEQAAGRAEGRPGAEWWWLTYHPSPTTDGVSGLWGSSALWAPGREVPTTPPASWGRPSGSGPFIAFPSIFLPFDPSRGCCFEAQQISACSLSRRDSPPGPGEGPPLPAGRGPGAHLQLPSESVPPALCTRTPQMTPGSLQATCSPARTGPL